VTPRVVAVCGKGGVGKTMVSAILCGELGRRKDRKALIIDADHAGGLEMALQLSGGKSINQVRVETIREIRKKNADHQDLARGIDYMVARALTEKGNLAFLSLGRPEEVGCYCSVNSLLREAIEQLAVRFDFTLIDAEAGIEQVNRNVMKAVDYLFLVSDTSAKAVRVAETIQKVAFENAGEAKAGLLVNRVHSKAELEEVKSRTALDVIGWIPEDETIRTFDGQNLSFFSLPPCPASAAVIEAAARVGVLG